jgi:exosortase D (VPLPA-CTERM-specific)
MLRMLIFISALPITVLMNIVRIAITGLLVDKFGLEAAQGFFHAFEGWAVFCLCIFLLLIEMKLLCLIDGRGAKLMPRLDITLPPLGKLTRFAVAPTAATYVVIALCLTSMAAEFVLGARGTPVLDRQDFARFPALIGSWNSVDVPLDAETLKILDVTDYMSRNYISSENTTSPEAVDVFVAYYDSQRSKSAIHSPQVCIPAGGWEVEQIGDIANPAAGANHLVSDRVKRLVIRRGSERQLVYYWFEIGGVPSINEYASKAYLFWSAVMMNRTDGALIRFVTPIVGSDGLVAADARLSGFIRKASQLLPSYIP